MDTEPLMAMFVLPGWFLQGCDGIDQVASQLL
jgi:hypothetical protein